MTVLFTSRINQLLFILRPKHKYLTNFCNDIDRTQFLNITFPFSISATLLVNWNFFSNVSPFVETSKFIYCTGHTCFITSKLAHLFMKTTFLLSYFTELPDAARNLKTYIWQWSLCLCIRDNRLVVPLKRYIFPCSSKQRQWN